MLIHVYGLITCLLCVFSIFFAIKSFLKRTRIGYLICACLSTTVVVSLLYLAATFCYYQHVIYIAASLHFIFMDVLVYFLAVLMYEILELRRGKLYRFGCAIAGLYFIIDAISLIRNINTSNVVTFERTSERIPYYTYHYGALYYFHLAFSYILVALILYGLIRKNAATPKSYRGYYGNLVHCISFAVLINAIYMFVPKSPDVQNFDVAIWVYSIVGALVFWNCFIYTTGGMINQFRSIILSNLNEGLLLFDYKGKLLMKNRRVEELLGEDFDKTTDIFSFAKKNGINLDNCSEKSSFRIYTSDNKNIIRTIVGTYRRVYEGKNVSAHLFTLNDYIKEKDSLTGFYNWDPVKKELYSGAWNHTFPATVVGFSVNNLTSINNNQSREKGDKIISLLADSMRAASNDQTFLVRYRNARLVAVVSNTIDDEEIKTYIEKIQRYFESIQEEEPKASFQYGYAIADESNSIVDAVHEAFDSLDNWKLIDSRSHRSQLISSLCQTLRETDNDTEEHVSRTQTYGKKLGKMLGLSHYEQSKLALLCILHDIGKVGIPLEILNKPGKLTSHEMEIMRTHSQKGYHIAMSSPVLEDIADCVLCHHERWDGKGYPMKLSGSDIPLLSRIIAVVDSYDAMTSDRVYRKAMPKEKAVRILLENSGTQFDPNIVEVFAKLLKDEEHIDPTHYVVEDNKTVDSEDGPKSLGNVCESDYVRPIKFSRYLLDDTNKIISIDNYFEALTGYNNQDVIQGLNQTDLIPKDDVAVYISQVDAQKSISSTVIIEHRILCKDSSIIFVNCIGETRFDSVLKQNTTEVTISIISPLSA